VSNYVLALDQGTTSSRAIVFDRSGNVVASGQEEHRQILPQPGWVEHNAEEIWRNSCLVVRRALANAGLSPDDIAAVGITNQRETTVVWDRLTGRPVHNAIVWQDTRTQDAVETLSRDGGTHRFARRTGLPISTYFAATKIAWILDHVEGARERAEGGDLLFGTMDTWLVWNLTGGSRGGLHITDVTNASRTLLMDLTTLDWDDELLKVFGVPRQMLPSIRSSSEVYGFASDTSVLPGVPIAGVLGDQQAAAFGQTAFGEGEGKNTYGTGCFLLVGTGEQVVHSTHGLITTVAYRLGTAPPAYALEGSIAVAGSLVQWLRDNLQFFSNAHEIEQLAASVDDNGGAYFVPAFSGLLAPYWRPDARGAVVGLTGYVTKAHIARAALESTAFQTYDVLMAVNADTGIPLTELRVDGGMSTNAMLMQFQADILGVPVERPQVVETTALGAAYAAGLAVGFWSSLDELRGNWQRQSRWEPAIPERQRDRLLRNWHKAVAKTLDWVDEDVE
jgi:glycerol kinase